MHRNIVFKIRPMVIMDGWRYDMAIFDPEDFVNDLCLTHKHNSNRKSVKEEI